MPARASIPRAVGRRVPWERIPTPIAAWLEGRLGSRVVRARNQMGGFSPALAARVELADGRRVFLKAVGPRPNVQATVIYRRELAVARKLPSTVPAPRFLWGGVHQRWVALAFEDLEGKPPHQPWRASELRQVVETLEAMARRCSPAPRGLRSLPCIADHGWSGFAQLQRSPSLLRRTPKDAWIRRHLDRLVSLEAEGERALRGTSLLHCDVRADNLLLTRDRVYLVDWPWACLGPAWLDLVFFLPSVAMQGGPAPERVLQRVRLGREADPHRVTVAVAVFAGFMEFHARQPPPPAIPNLRAFQRAQGREAVAWLRERTGWA